jgi:hypothetical protein
VKPSKQYESALDACKKHHATSKTYSGKLLRPHIAFIKEIVQRLSCTSILDYGCGKGSQYTFFMPMHGVTVEEYLGVPVTKYDPAWPPFADEPVGKFDLVICSHTLGVIPITDLEWVIDRLYSLANKALYIADQLGPSKKQVVANKLDFLPPDLTVEAYTDLLYRPDSDLEVTLGTLNRHTTNTIEHVRSTGHEGWPRWRPVEWSWARQMDISWA